MLFAPWKFALLCLLMLTTCLAQAETLIGNGISLKCQQPANDQLRCHYRLLNGGEILSASASIKDIPLPAPTYAAQNGPPASTAILLLVDTSDPGRDAAVTKAAAHIERILDTAIAQQRFALASFDSDLEVLAPLGTNLQQIRTAVTTLKAKGHTTELYRNIILALQQLAPAEDEQRVVMIFSDGLAEDRAYFNDDVVREALRQDIIIYGLGYPRSVAQSVGLQSLRRLADETGGRFIAANQVQDLPETFLEAPFVNLEHGGALSIDMNAADQQLNDGQLLELALETSAGLVTARIPVSLSTPTAAPVIKVVEVEVPKIIEVPTIIEKPAPKAAIVVPSPAPLNIPEQQVIPLWYWIAAVGILGLALLTLLLVLWSQRRTMPVATTQVDVPSDSIPALSTLATLSLLGGDNATHPIATVTYRIGRLADNDLAVPDNSVSRYHAEIRRDRGGRFKIIDLDSMNGVFVNGKKVRECSLKEADIVEVGDVRMSFSMATTENYPGEDTVMLKTALPDQSLKTLLNSDVLADTHNAMADTHIDKRSAATDDTVQ